MPDRQHGGQRFELGTTQTVHRAQSLPARISVFVFGATLLTSLLVTGISVQSIDSFLRERIEQNFPAILENASQRLNLWHDQRLLEVGVFASSGILTQNVSLLHESTRGKRAQRARKEVEQYLSYVLDSFVQYDALFVLGANGEPLHWVGSRYELPEDLVLGQLAEVSDTRLSAVVRTAEQAIQLASARIEDTRSRLAGTLHAVIRMEAVSGVLRSDDTSSVGDIFLMDASGGYLVASPERLAHGTWNALSLLSDDDSAVLDYTDHAGERVVGCTRSVPRFGWLLAVEEPYGRAFAPVVSGIRRILGINLAIVLLFALAAYRIAGSIARPIEALSNAARRISEGEKDVKIPESRSRDEVGVLTRTFREMTRRLENKALELEDSQGETEQAVARMRQQNEELTRVNEILEQLSITDGLTKLHNHRYFQEHLAREVKRADRTADPLTLVLIDIDHFKLWNDRLGHSGGDEILRRIAEIMLDVTRETDLLARYGGEEFALLLPDTEIDGAVRLGEKIRETVAETQFLIDLPSEQHPLTVSVGVSAYHGDKRSFFDEADQALYQAKASGRNCVVVSGAGS